MNNSPVELIINDVVKIDRRKSDSIYIQIVYQFINAIRLGIITDNTKLPGTRIISEILKVHRQTVVMAMNELSSQGWIEIIPNRGSFVKNIGSKIAIKTSIKSNLPERNTFFQNNQFLSNHHSFILDSISEESDCSIKIDDGQPDIHLFNIKELSRKYQSAFYRKNVLRQLEDFSNTKNHSFIDELTNYLNVTHQFQIIPQEITIASSKELLIYTISQLLIKTNDKILVGEFSYYFSNMIFQQVGAQLITIPVDENGMDVEYIRTNFQKGEIKCIYVNSTDHYPTTSTLSQERRQALLELSEEYGFIIIEENESFEFQYQSPVISPMYQMNNRGNIIFIGSFGKFMPPSFRINYLLAPHDLITEIEKFLQILGPFGDVVRYQVLSEMIRDGDIHRYRWKAIQIYRKRRDELIDQIQKAFDNNIICRKPQCGLAIWIEFKQSFSLMKWRQLCIEDNIFIPRINLYQNQHKTAVRIGLGWFRGIDIQDVICKMRKNWNSLNS